MSRFPLRVPMQDRQNEAAPDRRRHDAIVDIAAGTNYYDATYGTMVHKINEGGFCVLSRSDHLIMTTLGSCISVCMFDPVVKVGGMNHFLLPAKRGPELGNSRSMRYGINAMEMLFNEVTKRGGKKSRLVIKAFGAGRVLNISNDIGARNQFFLKQYMTNEGMSLAAHDLGGDFPRGVIFYPATGKAFVKLMRRASDAKIGQQEEKFRKRINKEFDFGDVKLF